MINFADLSFQYEYTRFGACNMKIQCERDKTRITYFYFQNQLTYVSRIIVHKKYDGGTCAQFGNNKLRKLYTFLNHQYLTFRKRFNLTSSKFIRKFGNETIRAVLFFFLVFSATSCHSIWYFFIEWQFQLLSFT